MPWNGIAAAPRDCSIRVVKNAVRFWQQDFKRFGPFVRNGRDLRPRFAQHDGSLLERERDAEHCADTSSEGCRLLKSNGDPRVVLILCATGDLLARRLVPLVTGFLCQNYKLI